MALRPFEIVLTALIIGVLIVARVLPNPYSRAALRRRGRNSLLLAALVFPLLLALIGWMLAHYYGPMQQIVSDPEMAQIPGS